MSGGVATKLLCVMGYGGMLAFATVQLCVSQMSQDFVVDLYIASFTVWEEFVM